MKAITRKWKKQNLTILGLHGKLLREFTIHDFKFVSLFIYNHGYYVLLISALNVFRQGDFESGIHKD